MNLDDRQKVKSHELILIEGLNRFGLNLHRPKHSQSARKCKMKQSYILKLVRAGERFRGKQIYFVDECWRASWFLNARKDRNIATIKSAAELESPR